MRAPCLTAALTVAGLAAPACGSGPAPTPKPVGTPLAVGRVAVDGLVQRPMRLSVADLAALPGHSLEVVFTTTAGTERHLEAGPLLIDVLARAGPRFDKRLKHGELRAAVVVTGADGYEVVLSYGEIDPAFGNQPVLLSDSEDGRILDGPRLVVPGDVMGGRDVTRVVHIKMGSADAGGHAG